MKNRKGFTLIELMIVIAIIGLLAGIALKVVGSSKEKTITQKTKADITIISQACQGYQKIFTRYPDIDTPPGSYSGGGTVAYTAAGMDTANKVLFHYMENLTDAERVENPKAPVFAQKTVPPFIEQKIGKNPAGDMYLDGWGYPLRVWWGRNHKDDINKNGNAIGGYNGFTYTDYELNPLDIYSMGANNIDDILAKTTDNTDQLTKIDFSDEETYDELVSWLEQN